MTISTSHSRAKLPTVAKSESDTAVVILLFADDDDGAIGAGFYSMLSFGDADPLGDAADPSNTAPGANGSLAAGTYTIVVGGFNTVFGATIGSITAGAASGAYSLDVTYVPAPGAVALMGLAGLVAGRRRR